MSSDPHNPRRKPLVSVEFQTEVDVSTGNRERRMFVKMYFDARDSGLLATLPDDLWKTLCLLATYMDESGNCYPSQAELARHLGVRREAVNQRVQRLLDFRFNGKPVLSVHRARGEQGRLGKNHYTLHPISSFAIFDRTGLAYDAAMCGQPHMVDPTMCGSTNIVEAHINQNQDINKTVNVNGLIRPKSDADAEFRVEAIVLEMVDVLGDPHSTGFYRKVTRTLPSEVIFRFLSETKDRSASHEIRTSRGAYFTNAVTRYARENGYKLTGADGSLEATERG